MPPLEVGTPAAAALQAAVAAELATALGPLEDDALPMYVVAMTSSGTGRAGVEAALGEFLPERAGEFAGWLFAHLVERAGEYGLTAEEAGKLAQGGDGDAGDGAGTERGRSRSRSPSAATARAMSRSRSRSGERAKAAAAAARGRGGRGRGGRGPPPTAAARSSVFDRLGSGGRGRGASSIASLPPPAASLVAAARFRELASLRLAALASPAGAAVGRPRGAPARVRSALAARGGRCRCRLPLGRRGLIPRALVPELLPVARGGGSDQLLVVKGVLLFRSGVVGAGGRGRRHAPRGAAAGPR